MKHLKVYLKCQNKDNCMIQCISYYDYLLRIRQRLVFPKSTTDFVKSENYNDIIGRPSCQYLRCISQ